MLPPETGPDSGVGGVPPRHPPLAVGHLPPRCAWRTALEDRTLHQELGGHVEYARRVRYRLRSAPMQVAQQFLAALARDWDGHLDALRDHLRR